MYFKYTFCLVCRELATHAGNFLHVYNKHGNFITTQHDTQDNISKPSYTRRKYGVFPEIQHSASCAGNLLHMQEISCMCTSDHLMTPTIFITTQHDTQDNISKPSYTRRKYGVFPEIQHSASCAGNLLHMTYPQSYLGPHLSPDKWFSADQTRPSVEWL